VKKFTRDFALPSPPYRVRPDFCDTLDGTAYLNAIISLGESAPARPSLAANTGLG
jgi:hypothetical protein